MFGVTVITPVVGLILNSGVGVDVKTTSPGLVPITTGVPFKVSFVITVGVVPFTAVRVSFMASIKQPGGELIVTVSDTHPVAVAVTVTSVPTGMFVIALEVTVPAEAAMLAPLGFVMETL